MAWRITQSEPAPYFVGDGGPPIRLVISEMEADPTSATVTALVVDEMSGEEIGNGTSPTASNVTSYTNREGETKWRCSVSFLPPTDEPGRFLAKVSLTISAVVQSVPFWIPFKVKEFEL